MSVAMAKILLIDDEKNLLDEISDWLQFAGYEVTCAGNGRIGLEIIKREKPDLIVCDIAMPEMDGRTVLLEVRADPQLNAIPFIFLTASSTHESLRRGMNLGADDYLAKPFQHDELLNAIKSRLHKQSEQQQTARLQLNAVQTALQEEQQRRLLKSRLMAMVSHDFRNPLLTILSSAELLEYHGAKIDDERRHKYLHRIQGSVHLLIQMLDDLLAVAELENQQWQYQPETIDIANFLEGIIDEFRMIDGDNHEFEMVALVADTVVTDPKLLRHIITNLLSNATKYSPTGSTVTVRVQEDTAKLAIDVIDQGIGIPEEDLAQLFNPFYRAAHTKDKVGTGLGLTIAHEAVTLCGGTIHVASELEQGSRFTVTLPRT